MIVPKFPGWQREWTPSRWLPRWQNEDHGYITFRRHKYTGEHRWCFYTHKMRGYHYFPTLRETIIWWASMRLEGRL